MEDSGSLLLSLLFIRHSRRLSPTFLIGNPVSLSFALVFVAAAKREKGST